MKKEDVGFEPTQELPPLTVFKTVPLSHLGNPPDYLDNDIFNCLPSGNDPYEI